MVVYGVEGRCKDILVCHLCFGMVTTICSCLLAPLLAQKTFLAVALLSLQKLATKLVMYMSGGGKPEIDAAQQRLREVLNHLK